MITIILQNDHGLEQQQKMASNQAFSEGLSLVCH